MNEENLGFEFQENQPVVKKIDLLNFDLKTIESYLKANPIEPGKVESHKKKLKNGKNSIIISITLE